MLSRLKKIQLKANKIYTRALQKIQNSITVTLPCLTCQTTFLFQRSSNHNVNDEFILFNSCSKNVLCVWYCDCSSQFKTWVKTFKKCKCAANVYSEHGYIHWETSYGRRDKTLWKNCRSQLLRVEVHQSTTSRTLHKTCLWECGCKDTINIKKNHFKCGLQLSRQELSDIQDVLHILKSKFKAVWIANMILPQHHARHCEIQWFKQHDVDTLFVQQGYDVLKGKRLHPKSDQKSHNCVSQCALYASFSCDQKIWLIPPSSLSEAQLISFLISNLFFSSVRVWTSLCYKPSL